MDDGRAHICSARIDRPAGTAMAFLQAPENLSSWAVGMGETTIHADGTIEGAFPATKQPIWARIDADLGRSTIHYHLGPDSGSLVPRIIVRVVAGGVLEGDPPIVRRLPHRLAPGDHGRRSLGGPQVRPRARDPGNQAPHRIRRPFVAEPACGAGLAPCTVRYRVRVGESRPDRDCGRRRRERKLTRPLGGTTPGNLAARPPEPPAGSAPGSA